MSEQPSPEAILNKTLYMLVRHLGMSPEEVASLRLSHVHLAGKDPNINFIPVGTQRPKTVELDLETHRALVSWLVARPDSVSDFLFPGSGSEAMDPLDIQQAVKAEEAEFGDEQALEAEKADSSPEPKAPSEDEDLSRRTGAGEATMASSSRPEPLPARPASPRPPPSAPEMGVPPPGLEASRPFPFPQRPTTAPEEDEDESASQPLPGQPFPPVSTDKERPEQAGPTPPDKRESGPIPRVVGRQEPEYAPRPVRERGSVRVPPKPVRKKDVGPTPVLMQRKEPDQAPPAASDEVKKPTPPDDEATPQTPDAQAPEAEALPKKETKPDEQVKPKAEAPPQKEVKPAGPVKPRPAAPRARKEKRRPPVIYLALGGIVIVLLLCVVCGGGSGWFVFQSETGQGLLASLGLFQAGPEEEAEVIVATRVVATVSELATGELQPTSIFMSPVSPIDSPLPTPTLPPTSTPTLLPPTNTPPPTETATPIPETTQPPPPATPVPTDTPVPPDTPTLVPTVAQTPTLAVTPTPAMKYDAPVLLEPEDGFKFISGNTIVLRWAPVGELAPDEQYAVRMVYMYQGKITYQGTNIKEAEWTVPLSLYGQIDPPDNRYEWFVVVERLNDDGSGTSVSPESERRTFTWK